MHHVISTYRSAHAQHASLVGRTANQSSQNDDQNRIVIDVRADESDDQSMTTGFGPNICVVRRVSSIALMIR